MAEVSWKTTFIGAFILFLIGLIVATCLNYAHSAFISIKAGISGPFECVYNETINRRILCNETDFLMPQDCIYIIVTFQSRSTERPIKLTPNYFYDQTERITFHHVIHTDDDVYDLGRCSADYCGNYRFRYKNDSSRYLQHPELIDAVNRAKEENEGRLECYLNQNHPENGAYLKLNDEVLVNPENRIFRWYEGWIIMISPLVIFVALVIYVPITFVRERRAAQAKQKPKESFVPPGFAVAASTVQIASDSSDDETEELNPKSV